MRLREGVKAGPTGVAGARAGALRLCPEPARPETERGRPSLCSPWTDKGEPRWDAGEPHVLLAPLMSCYHPARSQERASAES